MALWSQIDAEGVGNVVVMDRIDVGYCDGLFAGFEIGGSEDLECEKEDCVGYNV